MHLLFRNVNEAFRDLVRIFRDQDAQEVNIARRPSRAGEILQIEEPVIVTHTHPRERVLFNSARDANPFFHLYESLWMLAGRRDIAPLNFYSGNYAKQVKDGDSPWANGAYGFRWKHASKIVAAKDTLDLENVDQLRVIINHLKGNPDSRRSVLQMWNVEDDLLKIDSSKDVCCNTHAYFLINDGRLDMTVCNRSNDLIWGMLGANVVHFSILQEYLAACIGVDVGVYSQITNNLHVYTDRFEPDKWLAFYDENEVDQYGALPPMSLIRNHATFGREVIEFVERNSGPPKLHRYVEPFLNNVAQPMCQAFYAHKMKNGAALDWCGRINASDWRIVATEWIKRRMK